MQKYSPFCFRKLCTEIKINKYINYRSIYRVSLTINSCAIRQQWITLSWIANIHLMSRNDYIKIIMTLLSARQDVEITYLCSLNGNGNDLRYRALSKI